MQSIHDQLKELEIKLSETLNDVEREALFVEIGNAKFRENMLCFQQYFPDIYDRFLNYQPSEKFQLIVNDNGAANIIDHDTNVAMYSSDPKSQVMRQVDTSLLHPIFGRINYADLEHLETYEGFTHIDLMKQLGQVYNTAAKNLSENHTVDKFIPSMVVFGVGLGYHLELLRSKTKVAYINIFEPNEDYFFASLFSFDWKAYIENVDKDGSYLYLGVGLSESQAFKQLYNRAKDLGAYSISNSLFYQHYPSLKVNKLIDEFTLHFHQLFTGYGFYDDAMIGIAHSVANVKNNINILNSSVTLPSEMANFPVAVIANGPSLDNDIEKIKEIKDKVIIFSCNSASTALLAHGIVPDFHVALERTYETYEFLRDFIQEEYRQQMNLLVLNVMHPDVADLFGWAGISLKGSEAGTNLIQLAQAVSNIPITPTLSYSNPLVGNTGASFASHFGFKQIYLFGVDNGYKNANHHHSKASFYYEEDGETTKYEPVKMGGELSIPGNFTESVLTDEFMHVGNTQFERLVSTYTESGVDYFNCSDGAKITGTIPTHSADILLQTSNLQKADIIEFIKTQKFMPSKSIGDIEQYIFRKELSQICDTMIELLTQPAKERAELLENLLSSLRYLYSFKESSRYSSLFLVLEGEALYVSTLFTSLLYNFGSNEEILPYYQQAIDIWVSYLQGLPDNFDKVVNLCR